MMKAQYWKEIASNKIKEAFEASMTLNNELMKRIKSGRSKFNDMREGLPNTTIQSNK